MFSANRSKRCNVPIYQSVKPFLKCLGGKTRLLPELINLLPKQITKYAEPFAGGTALYWWLANNHWDELEKAVLNDSNKDFITTYMAVRHEYSKLVDALNFLVPEYLALEQNQRKEYYYSIRTQYNNRKINWSTVTRATHTIFLNHTGFNGLHRVNSKGLYNTPFGRYTNPHIFDSVQLDINYRLLQKAEITCGDFEEIESKIDAGYLVYFDPPYRPISDTANFASYTAEKFGDADQVRLAKCTDV